MTGKQLLAILDKNVNQEQLAKDMALELVLPFLKEKVAGVDLIPGTQIDNEIIAKVMAFLEAQLVEKVGA